MLRVSSFDAGLNVRSLRSRSSLTASIIVNVSHTTSFLGPPHSVPHVGCGGRRERQSVSSARWAARTPARRTSARIRARQSPLSETLLPFLASDEDKAIAAANESLKAFDSLYQEAYAAGMGRKLGFARRDGDHALIQDLLHRMAEYQADFTAT